LKHCGILVFGRASAYASRLPEYVNASVG